MNTKNTYIPTGSRCHGYYMGQLFKGVITDDSRPHTINPKRYLFGITFDEPIIVFETVREHILTGMEIGADHETDEYKTVILPGDPDL